MWKKLMAALAVTGAALTIMGCLDIDTSQPCAANYECVTLKGVDGYCAPGNDGRKFCMFPDSGCPSMWRWTDLANDTLKNKCVDPSAIPPPDGGAADGMADSASPANG